MNPINRFRALVDLPRLPERDKTQDEKQRAAFNYLSADLEGIFAQIEDDAILEAKVRRLSDRIEHWINLFLYRQRGQYVNEGAWKRANDDVSARLQEFMMELKARQPEKFNRLTAVVKHLQREGMQVSEEVIQQMVERAIPPKSTEKSQNDRKAQFNLGKVPYIVWLNLYIWFFVLGLPTLYRHTQVDEWILQNILGFDVALEEDVADPLPNGILQLTPEITAISSESVGTEIPPAPAPERVANYIGEINDNSRKIEISFTSERGIEFYEVTNTSGERQTTQLEYFGESGLIPYGEGNGYFLYRTSEGQVQKYRVNEGNLEYLGEILTGIEPTTQIIALDESGDLYVFIKNEDGTNSSYIYRGNGEYAQRTSTLQDLEPAEGRIANNHGLAIIFDEATNTYAYYALIQVDFLQNSLRFARILRDSRVDAMFLSPAALRSSRGVLVGGDAFDTPIEGILAQTPYITISATDGGYSMRHTLYDGSVRMVNIPDETGQFLQLGTNSRFSDPFAGHSINELRPAVAVFAGEEVEAGQAELLLYFYHADLPNQQALTGRILVPIAERDALLRRPADILFHYNEERKLIFSFSYFDAEGRPVVSIFTPLDNNPSSLRQFEVRVISTAQDGVNFEPVSVHLEGTDPEFYIVLTDVNGRRLYYFLDEVYRADVNNGTDLLLRAHVYIDNFSETKEPTGLGQRLVSPVETTSRSVLGTRRLINAESPSIRVTARTNGNVEVYGAPEHGQDFEQYFSGSADAVAQTTVDGQVWYYIRYASVNAAGTIRYGFVPASVLNPVSGGETLPSVYSIGVEATVADEAAPFYYRFDEVGENVRLRSDYPLSPEELRRITATLRFVTAYNRHPATRNILIHLTSGSPSEIFQGGQHSGSFGAVAFGGSEFSTHTGRYNDTGRGQGRVQVLLSPLSESGFSNFLPILAHEYNHAMDDGLTDWSERLMPFDNQEHYADHADSDIVQQIVSNALLGTGYDRLPTNIQADPVHRMNIVNPTIQVDLRNFVSRADYEALVRDLATN